MLEKIEKKQEYKLLLVALDIENVKGHIDIKKCALEKEEYTKTTLLVLYDRMKIDIQSIRKEIAVYELSNVKFLKHVEKEKVNCTTLKVRVNQLFSKEKKQEKVNL